MSKKILEQQKILMGIHEDSYGITSSQTPVTMIQKIHDLKAHAENTAHYAEIAMRAFKKISSRLKDFESIALESPEVLNGESKALMNVIRNAMESIDQSQVKANELLKGIDYFMMSSQNALWKDSSGV